jgi:transglutaminase-like putative cysteine protease
MKKTLVAFFLFTPLFVMSQKPPAKFGDIPMEDMKMKIYPNDSSAEAVVLFDYGVAYISVSSNTVNLFFDRHTRIKILKKEGLDEANISVPLFHSGSADERLLELKAITYNLENGKIVETKLSKDNVFKEAFNRNINVQKFTLPNTKEGSIIEYSYKISSEFITNFPNWRFQQSIPVRLSEYWAMIPEYFFFEKYMQGYVPLASYTTDRTSYFGESVTAHHYVSKNVPAFKEEPNMTSEEDYVSKINFALSHYQFPNQPVHEVMGSWEKLSSLLLKSESFGVAINKSGFLKDEVNQITAGMTDPLQKVKALTNYVKQNFEWNGTKDHLTDPLKKVFEKKKGTVADLNILLASMLDKAGIPVEMILLSTRDHGFIRKPYPMERQFNYVICSVKIGDKTYFLDATEKYLPFDVLPSRCLNGQGLRISETNFGWVDITPKVKEKTYTSADLALTETGTLAGKIDFAYDGYEAQYVRKNYFSKGEEKFAKDFLNNKQWTVTKNEFKDVNDVEKSVKAVFEINTDEHATSAGDVIYINPYIAHRIEENPYKSETRTYPVDYGNNTEQVYIVKIKIPQTYTVDELPKSKIISLPENGARFTYNVTQVADFINVTSNFQVNKILFVQNEYPLLREFYNQVVAKQAEQIVLKKK